MDRCNENVIEFLKNQERATITFSQGRYKSRIRKLAKEHPEACGIVAKNPDGSIYAHIPTSWIKISPPKEVSETQRERARERMQEYHCKHGSTLAEKGVNLIENCVRVNIRGKE